MIQAAARGDKGLSLALPIRLSDSSGKWRNKLRVASRTARYSSHKLSGLRSSASESAGFRAGRQGNFHLLKFGSEKRAAWKQRWEYPGTPDKVSRWEPSIAPELYEEGFGGEVEAQARAG